jgi:hypothetical protein
MHRDRTGLRTSNIQHLTSTIAHRTSRIAAIAFVSVLLLLLIAGSTFAQTAGLRYRELLRPGSTTFHHVPIGLCEDYPEESTTIDVIRGDMELLKRSGINVLRIAFGWDGIVEQKDQYNWLFWDDYVRMAVDEYGITLIPYVCYTPMWNSTGDSTNYWNHTPKDYDAFGDFVYNLVTRYKDRIKSWELWNEPDIKAYWSGTSEDLARLTKIGALAVRRADPEAMVVLAGLAGNTNFTLELFRDHGISPYVDVVNCHNYYETWNSSPIENVPEYIYTLSDILARYGNGQSLWMAEVGYSSFRRDDGFVSEWGPWSIYDYEHTPKYQAVQLAKTLTLLLSTEKLGAIAWYRIKDLRHDEAVIGDVNNRHLGVAELDWTPKPAEKAIAFMNTLFAQRHRSLDRQIVITKSGQSDSQVHAFELEDGSIVVVGWLQTRTKRPVVGQTPGNLKDTRTEQVTITLPTKLSSKAILYDEVGNAKPFSTISHKKGILTIENLSLAGGEIAILKISK